MKTLFILLVLVALFGQVVLAQEAVQQGASNLSAGGSRHMTPIELVLTFIFFFVVYKLFTAQSKKDLAVEPQGVTQDVLVDLVKNEVGELQPAGANSLVGGKLIETKDDIETYIFVAKVDKTAENQEKNKRKQRKRRAFLLIISALVVGIAMMFFLQ